MPLNSLQSAIVNFVQAFFALFVLAWIMLNLWHSC